jgi:hypothetical protein
LGVLNSSRQQYLLYLESIRNDRTPNCTAIVLFSSRCFGGFLAALFRRISRVGMFLTGK